MNKISTVSDERSGYREDISIIIPYYNQAEFVEKTLKSVLKQSFFNWECIIIDDGSTDQGNEKIKKYCKEDFRFKLYSFQNKGLAASRNRGIRKAKGKYLLFLDSDDLLYHTALETMYVQMKKDSNIDIAYGLCNYIDDKDNLLRDAYSLSLNIESYFKRLLIGNLFHVHAAMIKKSIILKSDIYFPENKRPEDWPFWLQLADYGATFKPVNMLVCSYRIHSKSMSKEILKKTVAAEKQLKYFLYSFEKKTDITKNFDQLSLFSLYIKRYKEALIANDMEAKKHCTEKLKAIPPSKIIGLSSYHFQVLGYYLDMIEVKGGLLKLHPLYILRSVKRLIKQ